MTLDGETMRLQTKDIPLREGESRMFVFNVDEGNPRSDMTITGPNQPNNGHVSISSDGVVNISGVRPADGGAHIAKWWNGVGDAKFTLNLRVEPGKSVHALS